MIISKKKIQFDENAHEDNIKFTENSFRVNYFLIVVDVVIS